jgi:hypothetical protein
MAQHSTGIRASVLLARFSDCAYFRASESGRKSEARFLRGKTIWADIGAMGYDWQSSLPDEFLGGSASRDQSMSIFLP